MRGTSKPGPAGSFAPDMAVRKNIAVYLMHLTTYLKQLTAANRGKDNSGNQPESQPF